jgi:trans-2,3-dihydro-3-hydroxyanthranilate isomerase
MNIRVQHWDAFTLQPGKGNPAGIVLSATGLSDADMQAIAQRIGFNDTAFVLPSERADFRIRYFAPRREVELCGHATIAAFSALYAARLLPGDKASGYSLETKAGILPIGIENSVRAPLIVMTQGMAQFKSFDGKREAVASAIGISTDDLHSTLPIVYGSTGRWTLVVPVKDLSVMQRMRPFPAQFDAVLSDMPGASIHPFCLETIDPQVNMHARHFSSPASGTLEDAVTGTASGVLGAYYRRFVDHFRDDKPLVVEQGYEVGREGTVQVWAVRRETEWSVKIAGSACFVKEIKLARCSFGVV